MTDSIVLNPFLKRRSDGLGDLACIDDWLLVEIVSDYMQPDADDLRLLQSVSAFFYVLANREFIWKSVVLKRLSKNARLKKSLEQAGREEKSVENEWDIVAQPGPSELRFDRSWKQTFFSIFVNRNIKLSNLIFIGKKEKVFFLKKI
jgi:hypothetical protein